LLQNFNAAYRVEKGIFKQAWTVMKKLALSDFQKLIEALIDHLFDIGHVLVA
jgi:hypothetical protein